MLIRPDSDERINQRITNLLPSVRQRSCRFDYGIFPREKVALSSSLFVYVYRRRGQKWGQSS
jgi:hypothetical protein